MHINARTQNSVTLGKTKDEMKQAMKFCHNKKLRCLDNLVLNNYCKWGFKVYSA
jgi:hypothetical protein